MEKSGLENYNQFILWKMVDGAKIPISYRTLKPCNPHSPHNQTSHEVVKAVVDTNSDLRIGFVITKDDPLWFIDIDAGVGPDGKWRDECIDIVNRFPGAFMELSQSGTGLHIIGSGHPGSHHRCKSRDKSFDSLFTHSRFIALTFEGVSGNVNVDHSAALAQLVADKLPPDETGGVDDDTWFSECSKDATALEDDEVIQKATSSHSKFGGNCPFTALWEKEEVILREHYPPDHGEEGYNASRADSALAQHLAFWCGGNHDQIMRLMNKSALKREKWEIRGDYYLPRTIRKVVSRQKNFYSVKKTTNENGWEIRAGLQYLTPAQQVEHFKGCVYVLSANRVLTPSGLMVSGSQFKAFYGGYIFALDGMNDKTTKNAFEVFTESQAVSFPKAKDSCFNPLLAFGTITEDGRVNTYRPADVYRVKGNIAPFLSHVEKLLPIESDREILLSYMAACCQMIGHKFQWCPVIQGVSGNGKTLLATVLKNAVGREYFHTQDPNKLDSDFNGWVEGNLVVSIEEIRTAKNKDLDEILKALITNEDAMIQRKGIDQRLGYNFANLIMFSNHKDAVNKTDSDRRYCPLYTAQQSVYDLERDGMTGDYFRNLYDWIKGEGLGPVNEYLYTRPITIDILGRAPDTSSTEEAISESYGTYALLLLEALENDEPGFRGELIDFKSANVYLTQHTGKTVSAKVLSQTLNEIGYVNKGRVRLKDERTRIYAPHSVKYDDLESLRETYLSLQ